MALETAYYLKHIGDVKSIDDFIKDTRLFNYAMKAFGLEDMAYAKAFMRKVLVEGVERLATASPTASPTIASSSSRRPSISP